MSTYNCLIIHYQDEKQIRLYDRFITNSVDIDNDLFVQNKDNKKQLNKKNKNDDNKERSINNSQNRTINKIYEITRSNKWEYFITLTFSPDVVDRYNYDDITKVLHNWIKNIKQNYSKHLKYIIVPELHKDGAYHFHGLIADIGNLNLVDSGHKTKTKDIIYNIENYDLGFTTCTKVKNNQKVSSYITKYITKDLCVTTKGKKRYWYSYNLNKPKKEYIKLDKEERKILIDSIQGKIKYSKGLKCGQTDNNVLYIEI